MALAPLIFTNGDTLTTPEAQAEAMYVAFFDRAGDAPGLNFWMGNLNTGQSINDVALNFSKSAEAQNVHPFLQSPSTDSDPARVSFIQKIYQDLFNRSADSVGLNYWDGQLHQAQIDLANGVTGVDSHGNALNAADYFSERIGNFIMNIIGGAQNSAAGQDITSIQNKVTIASYFTEQLTSNGLAYDGTNPSNVNSQAHSVVTATDSTSASVTTQHAAIDADVAADKATNGSTFTLTTALDSFAGGLGNDTFNGTYSDGGTGTNTFNVGDILAGNGGTDTLNITPNPSFPLAATSVADNLWTNISGIENIVIATAAGAQTITTGPSFEAAFAAAGVSLTTTSDAGVINIDMSTFTGAATITATTTGAGAQNITTGSGLATVTATAAAGAQTIIGADLVTVTATNHGAGAQHIISTGAGAVTVMAIGFSGAQTITTDAGADNITVTTSAGATNTISTGGGNDIITLSAAGGGASLSNTITAGTGADVINLGVHAASCIDTLVYAAGDSTSTAFDTVTNFALNQDVIHNGDTVILTSAQLGTGTVGAIAGTNAGLVTGTTLSGFLSALTTSATAGYAAFDDGHNTYVGHSDGTPSTTADVVVELIGVTASHGLATVAAASTIHIA
jgi:hypothetical protein